MTARTWSIADIDGRNRRTVTLEQYRAEIDAAKKRAEAIFNRDRSTTNDRERNRT